MLVHPFRTKSLVFHDGQSVKYIFTVTADIKEALYHSHRESLAESARTGKQSHFIGIVLHKIIKQGCLVHIVTALAAKLVKIFPAYGNTN